MIGIMSDSHDNLNAIGKAVEYFNQERVEAVIHAGDLISPFTVREFLKLKSPLIAIFGNNDGERDGLRKAYQNLCYLEDFKEISIGNRQVAVIHGVNQAVVDSLFRCGEYDVVITGHTHQIEIKKDKTLLINPGETCGYLTGDQTVILLEMDDLTYKINHL